MVFRLGLRTKFFLYSNTLIVVTMLLVTLIWVMHERASKTRAIESRGRSIVEAMAIPITDSLMYEDIGLMEETGLIENYITEILSRNQDLMEYVVVTDRQGRVIHSNRWELLGQPFDRVISEEALAQGVQVENRRDIDGKAVLEVRSPLSISTRFWGSLIVGFSVASVNAQVDEVARRAALVAFFLMLSSSVLTAVYVETLIRPILYLNQTMKRAGRGNLSVRAPAGGGDEVGELADAFNRMMNEMKQVRDREKVQLSQLAHTEKMAAVGTLAAGVAHEVRNPLAGVLASLENMRANPDDREMAERYVDLIEDGLQRIEHTVRTLLDFSREQEISLEPTSINHSLRHVAELAAYKIRKAGVEVVFDLAEPGTAQVMADHFQMEQLFLNLVLNAVEAMPEGGVLTLRTRVKWGKVEVAVEDTGVGIAEDVRDRIFDPFFTTREVGAGTGLGLAVSHSIVGAHRGTIKVESTPGRGSVFHVSFDAMARPTEET
uniref:histidine kinase n=1 Tax=uncultured sulfate-reducing bacterium TaxID=153939 RepID=Q3IBQ1_9BACT|nr:histidine protein kinase [uncultured sulfate-reducing bacterium]